VISVFDKESLVVYCDKLAALDKDLRKIIHLHGYPPFWNRKADFETLIHIILEQQVSLASAKAALDKLKLKINTVTAANLLQLTDEEMRSCYFSRQKTVYARHLAEAVAKKTFSITSLKKLNDDEVRSSMKRLKGIGDWTADVFLMMSLNRTDCFPTGDVALMNSIKKVKGLPGDCSREAVLFVAEKWKPYRTIAAYLLWHNYLSERKQKSSTSSESTSVRRKRS
jgi:DNA-3-methyladenine glycosylase II